jgi:transcriptional regulator with XRE-family HTH domain
VNATVNSSRPFAEKLKFLFNAVRHPSGREYGVTEVAEEINRRGLGKISHSYLSLLREGKKANPSKECVEALAAFFQVPASYFYDDEVSRWVEEELRLIASLRGSPVRHIALEAFGLSPPSLRVLAETIKHLRKLEGLPETSEEPVPKRVKRRWERDERERAESSEEAASARR